MSQQLSTSARGATADGRGIAASAGVGVFAAVIGYLLTYLLIGGEVREGFENVAEWKAVGWYHYSAHLVDLESSRSFGGLSGTTTVDLIAESSGTNAELLYLVPPLVLLAAGAFLALRLDVRDLGSAIVVGAPVTIGYAIVMGLGAIVTESSSQGQFVGFEVSGSVAPELLPAIALAGIMYPLVFATAGAVAASMVLSR